MVADRQREPVRRRIWDNFMRSAEWCMSRPLRTHWIAPAEHDPKYENLYDRFYGMMHDMAVMEHLAFAGSYSREPRFLVAAKTWAMTCARIWRQEADGEPDKDKAYAVLRLLKGIATAYDLIHDALGADERAELRNTIAQLGGRYYQWFLENPGMGTVDGHNAHHASVEAASLGIAALAVLGEVPRSAGWLKLMMDKHRRSLLPQAIAADGAQTQGPTFWASTMQYRIAFMDALHRVTGEDLFTEFAQQMDDRLALASIAGTNDEEFPRSNGSVILSPSYGQLDYDSPVLLYLARRYRRAIDQHLALWDRNLGSIQKTRYVTGSDEMMLFAWGGYAYAWYDPTVAPQAPRDTPLSFAFPSIGEGYLRESFEPGGIVAATRAGRVCVNIGNRSILCEIDEREHAGMDIVDDANVATLVTRSASAVQTIRLDRAAATLSIERTSGSEIAWRSHDVPRRNGNRLSWPGAGSLEVMEGTIDRFERQAASEPLVVGCGLLDVTANDPNPRSGCVISAKPLADRKLVLRICREASSN